MTWYRVHDLLRVAPETVDIPADAPDWLAESLNRAPWVVVRRAAASTGQIAVGVRGTSRAHRFALTISEASVREKVAPEELVERPIRHRDGVTALLALESLRRRLHGLPVRWGPTGSVGFELTSAHPCVSTASDLDVAVFVDDVDTPALARVRHAMQGLPARVDCLVELPCGAVSLTELLGSSEHVMLKSVAGPHLIGRDELIA